MTVFDQADPGALICLPHLHADQRDFQIMRGAQVVHQPHDFAVRHGAIGANENALIPVAAGRGIERACKPVARDRVLANRKAEIGL